MALDLTCNPTIREEVVRLRQAAMLEGVEAGLLSRKAAGHSARARVSIARRDAATAWHRHRPSKLLHAH